MADVNDVNDVNAAGYYCMVKQACSQLAGLLASDATAGGVVCRVSSRDLCTIMTVIFRK
jgi:hypothetical protein